MSESYVGEIRMFAGNYAPEGWAMCNGQLLSIAENDVLFALIGTTYGGDGQTNFALPDLRGRIPVHMGTNPKTGTNFSLAQAAGVENLTLTLNQLPAHSHTAVAQSNTDNTTTSPTNNVWAASTGAKQFSANQPDTGMNGQSLSSVGGNQPHGNMMPYLTVSFIISLYGIYPTQS